MNLKLRFTALFTFFVAIVLMISSATIYILYYNSSTDDSYQRLHADAVRFYDNFNDRTAKDTNTIIEKLHEENKGSFSNEKLVIYDSAFKILFKEPDSVYTQLDSKLIQQIRSTPAFEYRYMSGNTECAAFYMPEHKIYILISAVDNDELVKLKRLKLILGFVFAGGLLITLLISIFFVTEILSPLTTLSAQMQRTTELNLSERLDIGKGKKEVNQIAKNFNAMLERLNQAFESQKSFVHHASHELRTPLATMLSQTESALRKDLSKEAYKEVLESLQEDQIGLIDLTNSLLLLSQYEKIQSSGKWPFMRIDEVLYDTMSATKKMLQGVDVELQFTNVPEDENELMIKGNEALLKVAFSNLIKNAWQYSSDKKVIITIDAKDEMINVYFDNHGSILTESEIEKLKVPFFRGNNAANVKGFGLGLSIVQRIITLHHGSFEYSFVEPFTNRFTTSFKAGT